MAPSYTNKYIGKTVKIGTYSAVLATFDTIFGFKGLFMV